MADLLIVGPDGRVVTCPRGMTATEFVRPDHPVTFVDETRLKPGWRVYEPPAADDVPVMSSPVAPVVEDPIITITAVDTADLDADPIGDIAWKDE